MKVGDYVIAMMVCAGLSTAFLVGFVLALHGYVKYFAGGK